MRHKRMEWYKTDTQDICVTKYSSAIDEIVIIK